MLNIDVNITDAVFYGKHWDNVVVVKDINSIRDNNYCKRVEYERESLWLGTDCYQQLILRNAQSIIHWLQLEIHVILFPKKSHTYHQKAEQRQNQNAG